MAESPNKSNGGKKVDEFTSAIYAALVPAEESQNRIESTEETIDLEKANAKLTYENRLIKKSSRKWWNRTPLTLVVLGFIISYVMIFLIGSGAMKFGDNVFAVPAVVAAGVLETYGLAKLAIQYFFNDNDTPN